jgi:hypothetical protein
LEINTQTDGYLDLLDDQTNSVEEDFEIFHYTSIFEQNLRVDEYNYYIFAKFIDLNEKSASIILAQYDFAPLIGLVLFSNKTEYLEDLDESEFSIEYLTTLFLHHFIRLLGFNAALGDINEIKYIPKEGEIYYLKTDDEYNFTNVINYARKYFNCDRINRIDLYLDDENLDGTDYYYYAGYEIIGLYWPKRLFLGELLTKFDYLEEQVLSGFTLAFLDDLPYLKVTKNYSGGSLKFGKNKGCEFFFNQCGDSNNP